MPGHQTSTLQYTHIHDEGEHVKGWTVDQATRLSAPDEVQVITRRHDGTLSRPRTIWIVRDGERVFIRSTNGRGADWFRAAIATGTGQIIATGQTYDVAFIEVTDAGDLEAIAAGYRAKYRRYPSIVDHLEEDEPRSATLQVAPA
jgi:hypothetical protein